MIFYFNIFDIKMECQATTGKGTRCSRKAEPGSNYCWQHKISLSLQPEILNNIF